jgi:hypothetical protein
MNLVLAAVFGLAFFLPAPAQGRVIPVDEMARKADVAGVATVQDSRSRHDPRTGFIYTDHSLKFEEVWKGSPSDPFILTQAGGQVGDQRAAIAGHHFTFRPGERIVVFAVPSHLGNHVLIGIRQGLYRVEEDKPEPRVRRDTEARSGMTLAELREEVARVLGRDSGGDPAPRPPAPSGTPRPPGSESAPQAERPPSRPPHTAPPATPEEGLPSSALAAAALILAAAAAVAMGLRRKGKLHRGAP